MSSSISSDPFCQKSQQEEVSSSGSNEKGRWKRMEKTHVVSDAVLDDPDGPREDVAVGMLNFVCELLLLGHADAQRRIVVLVGLLLLLLRLTRRRPTSRGRRDALLLRLGRTVAVRRRRGTAERLLGSGRLGRLGLRRLGRCRCLFGRLLLGPSSASGVEPLLEGRHLARELVDLCQKERKRERGSVAGIACSLNGDSKATHLLPHCQAPQPPAPHRSRPAKVATSSTFPASTTPPSYPRRTPPFPGG